MAHSEPTKASSADDVIPNYTRDADIFDTKTDIDKNGADWVQHAKITIVNKFNYTIWPVVQVGIQWPGDAHATIYRIYVHYDPDMKNLTDGIKPGEKADVFLPTLFWVSGGRIEVFTKKPDYYNHSANSTAKMYSVQSGTNTGNLLYSNTDGVVKNDLEHAQLLEYTIEPKGKYTGADGVNLPNALPEAPPTVDYDVSYVDHVFLPVAMEVNTGAVGWTGSNEALPQFEHTVQQFVSGCNFYKFFKDQKTKIGWPYYYNTNEIPSSDCSDKINPNITPDNMFKIPGGYNVLAETNLLRSNEVDGGVSKVQNAIINRFQYWINYQLPANITYSNANNDQKFAMTLQNIYQAFKYVAIKNKAKYNNLTLIKNIIGYVPKTTNANGSKIDPNENPMNAVKLLAAGVFPYPSAVPLFAKTCTLKDPKLHCDDNLYNYVRDAVKSVLRGVPYPYWSAENTPNWYPGYEDPKNLDPYAYFVHKKLNLGGYGFSLDDDQANIETPGTGFKIIVGYTGKNGSEIEQFKNPLHYDHDHTDGIGAGYGWDTLESKAIPKGSCYLAHHDQDGSYCPMILTEGETTNITLTSQHKGKNISLSFNIKAISPQGGITPRIQVVEESCKAEGSSDNANLCKGVNVSLNMQYTVAVPPAYLM